MSATCICGSHLWPYRGIEALEGATPIGHEYCGIVEEVGGAVATVKPGQFVVGSFWASDNPCELCQAGYQSACVHRTPMGTIGTQAEYARIPFADGTLVATPDVPSADLVPHYLAASDVLGTGWFAPSPQRLARARPSPVVGDGAVGLLGILAARQLGAERIIAMSRHENRQKPALDFGATESSKSAATRASPRSRTSPAALARTRFIEAVGTQESVLQAIKACRPGGHVGFVGVTHEATLRGHGPFHVPRSPPRWPRPRTAVPPRAHGAHRQRRHPPGTVFDLTLPLHHAAEGYLAMDERRAIKALLTV